MQYSKPELVELNASAASGHFPACRSGAAVAYVLCSPGGVDTYCDTGTSGNYFPGQDCGNGTTPTGGYCCVTGGDADLECAIGVGASAAGVCTAGPSLV